MALFGARTPLDLLRDYRKRLVTTVAPADQMVLRFDAATMARIGEKSWEDQYFRVGEAALRAVVRAMLLAEKTDLASILDLPCGHGRVLRTLRAAFPGARIAACDLDAGGVEFCARTFAAEPVHSAVDPAAIPLTGTFELIWCGSLLTHVDAARYAAFVRWFLDRLAPEGLLVFTSHGRWSLDYHRTYPYIAEDRFEAIVADVAATGFGYRDYPGQAEYGISIALPSWVARLVEGHRDATLLAYHERGWGHHQDVVVVWKKPIDVPPGLERPRPAIYRGHYDKFALAASAGSGTSER
ncbi:MAG: class I SAM-dependent methyltransferase [Alphaproteobacteria bacterium]|nr:class I SAM-dependent methyltransferase [Alphaproteobacteria bacterium]